MEKYVNMYINLDEFMKELAQTDVAKLDDPSLCELGLKLRVIRIAVSKRQQLTKQQQETVRIFTEFDEMVTEEMAARGYKVVDSDDLRDASPEVVAEALMSMGMQELLEWSASLEGSTDDKDVRMQSFINNELVRRCMGMNGYMPN